MDHEVAILKSVTGEAMALQGVTAKGKLNGLLFELTVEQRYSNTTSTNIEAVYTFPLPSAAVLLDFAVQLNGKLLTGVVVEKCAAEKQYEDAIDKGDTAIMLERAGNGLCTVNLGNVMTGEEATIRFRYAQLLRFEHRSVRLAVPTVIAPRYGDPATAGLQPHQQPQTDLAVAYPFALTVDIGGAIAKGKITSPSHRIATAASVEGVTVSLAQDAYLDRDFVLAIDELAATSMATVARDGDGYVALASFCADVPRDQSEAPLRLKVLVDCSGSMNGDSIDAARRALHRVFAGLTAEDKFTLSRFGSTVHHDVDTLKSASPEVVRNAATHLAAMSADLGGTQMEVALRSVFALGCAEGAADVLLITDGEIWSANSLVVAARNAGQRVFTVGIGAAPAEGVLRQLADATGGACEFVAPSEDAEAGILRMFARLRSPRVDHADVNWPAEPTWVTSTPRGLFGGETIHVFAGFASVPAGEVAIRLVGADGSEPLVSRTNLPDTIEAGKTFARIAGAKRIETADTKSRLALALQYQLLTDATNFIVVHERAEGEKSVDLPRLAQVAQMHAAGWGGVGSVQCVVRRLSLDSAALSVRPEEPSRAYSPGDTNVPKRDASIFYGSYLPGLLYDLSPVPGRAETFVALEHLARVLDEQYRRPPKGMLPGSLADLRQLGVDEATLELLAMLVTDGVAEETVVRAFLEALESVAKRAGASRQLQRALRNQFKTRDEFDEVRRTVNAVVVGAGSAQVPAAGQLARF
jgi:Ca-activated chloride channel homolog